MWLDYDQHDLEKDDIACYTPIINFISIHELLIVGLKIGVAGSFHVIFEDEADGVAELANLDIVLIDEAKVPRYIFVLMALILMSADMARYDNSHPINHPEKVCT